MSNIELVKVRRLVNKMPCLQRGCIIGSSHNKLLVDWWRKHTSELAKLGSELDSGDHIVEHLSKSKWSNRDLINILVTYWISCRALRVQIRISSRSTWLNEVLVKVFLLHSSSTPHREFLTTWCIIFYSQPREASTIRRLPLFSRLHPLIASS